MIHGITLQGERDPRLVNFSRSLAESGVRAAAAALPALKRCRFEAGDTEAVRDLSRELRARFGGRVGIIGFSVGAGIALTAAAHESVSEILDPLLLFGPHYSLDEVWNMLLKQAGEQPRSEKEWDDHIWLRLVLAYRVLDDLKLGDADRKELVEVLRSYCSEKSFQRKMRLHERVLAGLDIERACAEVLDQEASRKVSPRGRLAAVRGRVLILHDEFDGLVPPEQSKKIVQEILTSRPSRPPKLCITPMLSHVTAGSAFRFLDVFRILRIMGEIFS